MPKKKKSTSTVNVDAVKKEVNKMVKEAQNNPSTPGPLSKTHAELAPGSVRRESPLEQDMGTGKYKEMIHDHNEKNKHILDRLPFTFPKKKMVRSHLDVVISCSECGLEKIGSENTVGFTCPNCKKYVTAEFKSPVRVFTATVVTEGGGRLLPVRTDKPVLRSQLKELMQVLARVRVKPPVRIGQEIIHNMGNIYL